MAIKKLVTKVMVITLCSRYSKFNLNHSPKSNQIFKTSIHQSYNITNKTLVRIRVKA